MVKTDGFKERLRSNTNYSEDVIGDTVSRIKRADGILDWNNEETYIFYLARESGFVELSVSVRSQLRKAVKLYSAYANDMAE